MSKVSIGILLYFWVVVSIGQKNDNYADRAIVALHRVLMYMKENAQSMNVDAIFGLVLAQANLQSLLQQGVPRKLHSKIQLLEHMANQTLYTTQSHLEKNEINTLFLQTLLVVESWWKRLKFDSALLNLVYFENKKLKSINTLEKYENFLLNSSLTEEESDRCLKELLEQQKVCCSPHKCSITSKCQRLMIKDFDHIEPAYGVTHNLLFLQVARSQKCYVNEVFLAKKIQEYCSYIYWEASKNYEYGFLYALNDLFLEQVTLCGFEGFSEFLQNDFIEHILSLQSDNGCFTLFGLNQKSPVSKRETHLLRDGCADHTTGLGASALSIILRYKLRTT